SRRPRVLRRRRRLPDRMGRPRRSHPAGGTADGPHRGYGRNVAAHGPGGPGRTLRRVGAPGSKHHGPLGRETIKVQSYAFVAEGVALWIFFKASGAVPGFSTG